MPIEYFSKQCRSSSTITEFGLCDNPKPANDPAYISEYPSQDWIAIVRNISNLSVDFFAIDNCVEIRRSNGQIDSRCDGVLKTELGLIFVELKSRESGQWVKKGREQITATFDRFTAEVDVALFKSIRASVCNNLRPHSNVGHMANIQQFHDDTGLVLSVNRVIEI